MTTVVNKTLDELAMEYAIVSLGVDFNKFEGVFELNPKIKAEEWQAGHLRHQMEMKFGCFETQEAIKHATETLRMVIPDDPAFVVLT